MHADSLQVTGVQETIAQPEGWYAVYTKHQHEKKAADLLQKRGFEVFLPLLKERRRWKDRTKHVSLPMFPCYLFSRITVDRKLEILQIPGVFRIVENSGRVCPVLDSEIEAIRKVAGAGVRVEPHPYLTCGTSVRVSKGSLAGLTGILVRVKNEDRVVVSLKLLQKAVSVEVDRSDLEPVPEGTEAS